MNEGLNAEKPRRGRRILAVRRVQRVGYSTLTVSLPKEWADQNKVKQGDFVTFMQEEDGALRIEKGSRYAQALSTCPSCGATIPPDSRFCKDCGASLPA